LDRFIPPGHDVRADRFGESVPPTGSPDTASGRTRHGARDESGSVTVAAETVSNLIFTGPLAWTADAACVGQTDLFFAPAGERPETRTMREARARAICRTCPVLLPCRDWARENREYGFWGGESEENRAAAGYRVDMPVGRVARYPKGDGQPVQPRQPRVA
jgi:WhiB family transcriptional regulator, redox-sensing transcriptional regulator